MPTSETGELLASLVAAEMVAVSTLVTGATTNAKKNPSKRMRKALVVMAGTAAAVSAIEYKYGTFSFVRILSVHVSGAESGVLLRANCFLRLQ